MKKQNKIVRMELMALRQLLNWLKSMQQEACLVDLAQAVQDLLIEEATTVTLEVADGRASSFPIREDGIYIGELGIQPNSRKVTMRGEEVALTPKEFDILYFLARNQGTVFTKEQIYQAVWEEDFLLADSNIMAFIRKLRKKIEPNPDSPEYVLTIWGVGYKMNDRF